MWIKSEDNGPDVYGDETVTYNELVAAFKRLGYADFTSPGNVRRLVNDIKQHREPEWYPGDVVKDAAGAFWRRITGTHPWVQFGSQAKYREESPVRPLKRVVA